MLLSLLLDYESLFDGTLGDWNRPPVFIKMKDHGRPYPIPQIHKATLMEEIDRLMGIGVLKRQSSSQWVQTWGAPSAPVSQFLEIYPMPLVTKYVYQEVVHFLVNSQLLNAGLLTHQDDIRKVHFAVNSNPTIS
jgi:hypothetical protein